MKPYFLERVAAYFIDTIIISVISGIFLFLIPATDRYKIADKDMNDISDELVEKIENNEEVNYKEYLERFADDSFIVAKESVISSVIDIVIIFGYFATLAFYLKGQTLGKKIFNLRVVDSDGGNAGHIQLFIRTGLFYGTFFSLLLMILLVFLNAKTYFVSMITLSLISSIFTIVCSFFAIFRKDGKGLHDLICKTKVISMK